MFMLALFSDFNAMECPQRMRHENYKIKMKDVAKHE
jgi:hypothetical protein